LDKFTVVNRATEDRLTNTISEDQRDEYFSKEVYMVNLESVTLIALTSVRLEQTVKALEYSCKGILQRLN
jgi:hypothetical protein